MAVYLPPIGVLKKIWDSLFAKAFKPFYEQSQDAYLADHQLDHWHDLQGGIQVAFSLPSILSDFPARIAIRTQKGFRYEKAEFYFVAEGEENCYQQFISLASFGDKAVIHRMDQIPIQESYKRFYVVTNQLVRDGAVVLKDLTSTKWTPGQRDLLNSTWDLKWNSLWNCDLIDVAKQSFHEKARVFLLGYTPSLDPYKYSIRQIRNYPRAILGYPIYALFCSKLLLNFTFWTLLILRLGRMEPSGFSMNPRLGLPRFAPRPITFIFRPRAIASKV
jgi:hypothetical protein